MGAYFKPEPGLLTSSIYDLIKIIKICITKLVVSAFQFQRS